MGRGTIDTYAARREYEYKEGLRSCRPKGIPVLSSPIVSKLWLWNKYGDCDVGDINSLIQKLTPADKERFHESFDQVVAEAGGKRLVVSTTAVAEACRKIDGIFEVLARILKYTDATEAAKKNDKPYPKLLTLKKEYQKALQQSRELAVKTATYGERLEQVIAQVVQDKNIPKITKIRKVDQFIEKAKELETQSQNINELFDNLKPKFEDLTDAVNAWAPNAIEAFPAKITELSASIDTLNGEIATLKGQRRWKFAAAGCVVGVILVVLGKTACLAPVLLTTCGSVVTTGSFVILGDSAVKGISKSITKNAQAAEKAMLEQILQDPSIHSSLSDCKDEIETLNEMWVYARNDALAIKEYLVQGKDDFKDLPLCHLVMSAGQKAGIYSAMAKNLRAYADGIPV